MKYSPVAVDVAGESVAVVEVFSGREIDFGFGGTELAKLIDVLGSRLGEGLLADRRPDEDRPFSTICR